MPLLRWHIPTKKRMDGATKDSELIINETIYIFTGATTSVLRSPTNVMEFIPEAGGGMV